MLRELLGRHDALLAAALAAGRPELAFRLTTLAPLARSTGVGVVEALQASGAIAPADLERARARTVAIGAWRGLEVVRELGRGAHGVVLLARHPAGEAFALKVLRSAHPPGSSAFAAERDRFAREARLLARLEHPGIARLRDAGEEDGLRFLLTEAALGPSLAERGRLAPRAALELGIQAAAALAHAHGRGIVHRDLKPSNVLLDPRGSRLVDFGLAKDLSSASHATASHALVGTLAYASPEQLVVAGGVDPGADVYALAAVVHFALTGQPPFGEARSLGEHFGRLRRGFASISAGAGLPEPLGSVVSAILAEALRADRGERSSLEGLASGLAYAAETAPA